MLHYCDVQLIVPRRSWPAACLANAQAPRPVIDVLHASPKRRHPHLKELEWHGHLRGAGAYRKEENLLQHPMLTAHWSQLRSAAWMWMLDLSDVSSV